MKLKKKFKKKLKEEILEEESFKRRTKKISFREKFKSRSPEEKQRIHISNKEKHEPKVKCGFIDGNDKQCRRNAIRGDHFCRKHGGTSGALALPVNENIVVTGNRFSPSYHPLEYIKLASEGLSDVEIAQEFNISKQTLLNWADKYSQFSEAYELGKTIEEAGYIRIGRNNLTNTRFNTHLFKFMTGNRLGYAEKVESKNLNMNVSGVLKVPGKMSDSEWEEADFTEKKDH